jgi:hypothetical protein
VCSSSVLRGLQESCCDWLLLLNVCVDGWQMLKLPCVHDALLLPVQIIDKSKTVELDEEGCLSFPKIYADVEVGPCLLCWRLPRSRADLCGRFYDSTAMGYKLVA